MMIREFQRALSQLQLNFGAFCRDAAWGFGSSSHISQSKCKVFLHPACPAKDPGLLLGKQIRKQKVQSEADSDFPDSPDRGDVEGAAWQMGPLGVHRFVTPYKASQSNRRA